MPFTYTPEHEARRWHYTAEGRPHIVTQGTTAARRFTKLLDRRWFRAPSVAVDAEAFASAMAVADELVLTDMVNFDVYHFQRARQERWAHVWNTRNGPRVVVNLTMADVVEPRGREAIALQGGMR